MKTDKKNNPIVAGILLFVLVGLVVYTFRQSRGDDAPAPKQGTTASSEAAPDTAADTSGDTTTEKSAEKGASNPSVSSALTSTRPIAWEAQDTEGHDPFFHPSLRLSGSRSGAAGKPTEETVGSDQTFAKSAHASLPGLSPTLSSGLSPAPITLGPLQAQGISTPLSGTRPLQTSGAGLSTLDASSALSAGNETAPERLRLTAILTSENGLGARAVIEGIGTQPCTVQKGDTLGSYRVAAIHRREIVLAGRNGLLTLPLSAQPSEPSNAPVYEDLHGKKAAKQELEGE